MYSFVKKRYEALAFIEGYSRHCFPHIGPLRAEITKKVVLPAL